jgi:hypothetical protein
MVLCFVYVAEAQDAHHWSQQYGTKSTLLGGAVIGSNLDLSATYYNPGAVALIEDYEFLLSANVVDYSSLKFSGLSKTDHSISGLTTQPDFVAVALPASLLGGHQLSICYLKRQRSGGMLEGHNSGLFENAQGLEETDISDGEVILDQDLNEDWFGLGYSTKLNSNAGIGASTFLAARTHRTRIQTTAQQLLDNGDVSVLNAANEFDYLNVRLLWKLGLALDYDPLTVGFAVTTPSVNLFGSGSAFFSRTSAGFDIDGDGIADPVYGVDYQEDLDSKYPSRWAVGAGAAYAFGATKLHFSAEWYSDVETYKVLDPEPAVWESTGEPVVFPLEHELDGLINWGIGLEHKFSNGVSAYGGFATDLSAASAGSSVNLALTTWDIYQVVAGTSFTLAKTSLNLGLGYAFGSDSRSWPYGFEEVDEDVAIAGGPDVVEADFKRIKFIFGFSFDI